MQSILQLYSALSLTHNKVNIEENTYMGKSEIT